MPVQTVLMSYCNESTEDTVFAHKLARDLKTAGVKLWLDTWEIEVGDSRIQRMEQGLSNSDYLVIVLSPDAIQSGWVQELLNAAQYRQFVSGRKIVLPVLYRDCEIPLLLKEKHMADCRKERYQQGLEGLLKVLAPQRRISNGIVFIPSGEFLMGGDIVTEVDIDGFYIDKCPVTNAQYKVFVDAENHPPPPYWIGGSLPEGLEMHPVVGVTWYDAQAYANWLGKKLPTSARWEKAARGMDGRRFPWGNEFDPSKCNTREGRIMTTTPVGEYPDGASPFGVLDMAGNVWEWTRSEDSKGRMIIRGGAWKVVSALATCFYTLGKHRGFWNDDLGFRCIKEYQ